MKKRIGSILLAFIFFIQSFLAGTVPVHATGNQTTGLDIVKDIRVMKENGDPYFGIKNLATVKS